MSTIQSRIQQCMEEMTANNLSKLLVTSKFNLTYLLDLGIDTGERMVVMLVEPGKRPRLFIHEMFNDLVAELQKTDITFYKDTDNPVKMLASFLAKGEVTGIDQMWPSSFLIDLINEIEIDARKSKIVEKLRQIKDNKEISILRQSARIADAVMHQVLELQHFPTTERELSETIRSFFFAHGVQELSFTPIIGFGKNSANPHHVISDQGNFPNQPIAIDMGGIYKNYCSDITRTIFYGKSDAKYKDIYQIVKEIQFEAIELIRPGVSFSEIDYFIRRKLSRWHLEDFFIHRTGHGIGLELHEEPFIHSNNDDLVKEGMAFSIEPGVYLPDQFGVRIEDIVVVTSSGTEVLNQFTKEALELDLLTT